MDSGQWHACEDECRQWTVAANVAHIGSHWHSTHLGSGHVSLMACMDGMDYDQFIGQHRRGKRRHRAEQYIEEDGPLERSKLAHMLLEMWAWGEISAFKLQQIAEAGVHDDIIHPDIEKIGIFGKQWQTQW